MTVLVDTSVWVDFFNGHPSPEAEVLAVLIEDEVDIVTCGVVITEFFQGIRNRGSLESLEPFFRDMKCLTPTEPDSYLAAAALYRNLRRRGVSVRSTIDCLIARLAEEAGVVLLAKDRDMRHILASGLCGARRIPSGWLGQE